MGIFKKILQKKEKGDEKPPAKKGAPIKKSAPPRADPLAPSDDERKLSSPTLPSHAHDMMRDLDYPEEKESRSETTPRRNAIDSPPSLREESRAREVAPESSSPETPDTILGPVSRKVREAERGLTDMERILTEAASIFRGAEVLPKLKILLVEAKIKLAEAEIKLSEAEIAPAGSPISSGEIENRISLAESKIGEAEKILSQLATQGSGKGTLSRLKIGVAGMKIRLAEIQIALAGSALEGGPVPAIPSSDEITATISQPPPKPAVPSGTGNIRMGIEGEAPMPWQSDPPKEVKIRSEPGEMGVPLEARNEPVRIKDEGEKISRESLPPPSEQSEKIILPDMESDPSPFETGINMNRVRIRTENPANATDPQGISRERVKIRSDERESAWVTEDGSLKIVSREKSVSEHSGEEEKPRISIRQPEVEKVLIIEDLNRRGIEQRKKGEIEGALESFERVLEIDPQNEAALHNKGVALRSAGRYAEALACFERAQERDPDNPVILFNRGFCLGKLERYEEALKAFDRVLALEPEHASGWFNKGKILQKMGRMEEAEEHLKKAQELGYH